MSTYPDVPVRPDRETELALEAEARAKLGEWAMVRDCRDCGACVTPVDHDPAGDDPWQSCGECGARFPGAALHWRVVDDPASPRMWLLLRKGDFGRSGPVDRGRHTLAPADCWRRLVRAAARCPEPADQPKPTAQPAPCRFRNCDRLSPPLELYCCLGCCNASRDPRRTAVHDSHCNERNTALVAA